MNVGVPATYTASFTRTYTCNDPDTAINDLEKYQQSTWSQDFKHYHHTLTEIEDFNMIAAIDFWALMEHLYNQWHTIQMCLNSSLDGNSFKIILTPQTIRQIQISFDDGVVNKDSGQAVAISFANALEIEEIDPALMQIGDPLFIITH